MTHTLVAVRWWDAHVTTAEGTREEIMVVHHPAAYWSVGVLVESDARGITLTQDLGEPLNEGGEYTYRGRTFIPRELVDEERDLGPLVPRGRRRSRPADGKEQTAHARD